VHSFSQKTERKQPLMISRRRHENNFERDDKETKWEPAGCRAV
jgi:hypothetical protein